MSSDTPEVPETITTTTTNKPIAWQTVKPLLTALMSRAQRGQGAWPVILPPETQSVASMMPQAGWWQALSPEIRQGIWEPIQEGANNLFEQFGSRGMAGSARGGTSGAFGAGLGDYQQTMLPQAAMTGWNMISPALQAGWNAEQARNTAGWQAVMQSMQFPYNILPGLIGTGGTTTSEVPYWPPQSSSGAGIGGGIGMGLGALASLIPGLGLPLGAGMMLGGGLGSGIGSLF